MLPLAYLIASSTFFVLAALAVGGLAADLTGHYYRPHVLALTHTLTLGWMTLSIMGASYQVVPVVFERSVWSERLGRWQLAIFVAGAVGMIGHFYIGQWSGLVWGAALVDVAVVMYLANLALTLRRMRRWTAPALLVAGGLVGLGLTAVVGSVLGANHLVHLVPGQFLANVHAHAHLALLGWVLPVVLGVSARLYPTFGLAPALGRRTGRLQLAGLAVGVPLVVAGLVLSAEPVLALGALGVTVALVAHLAWLAGALASARRRAPGWALRFVVTGGRFLVPTAIVGLGLAAGVMSGPRVALAYAVLALGGWISFTIAGMMLKIVPMLVWHRAYSMLAGRADVPTLAELSSARAEAAAYVLLVVGVPGLAIAVLTGDVAPIRTAGAAIALGGLAFAAALARALSHLARAPIARPQHHAHARRAS